jgi:lysophospholipase L1-like esterase
VSTSVSDTARAEREGAPPDWSPVPERRDGGEPSRLKIAWRALAAGAVVTVLWLLGHEPAAIVLLVLLVTVTVLSATVPAVARAVDRGERLVQSVAGRGLRFVLLGALQLIIFTPVSLVLRLVRHDPLALGADPEDATFWRPAPARPRPLHRHLYTYERIPVEGVRRDRLPLPRLRMALGIVALALALDVAGGALLEALDGEEPPTVPRSANSQLLFDHAPAGDDEPWRAYLGWEITHAWDGKRYDPFLGWTLSDYSGDYVNVEDGVRRSYEPAGGADPVAVYFLGGSAMFGWFQRDGHTIPSQVARLAEADGIPLRVVNYGVPGYTNWQASLRLQELVSGGHRPDIAVFYDGANELVSQFGQGLHTEPTTTLNRQIAGELGLGLQRPAGQGGLGELIDAWESTSAAHRVGERLGLFSDPDVARVKALVSPWLGDQSKQAEQRGRNAAVIQARGVDVVSRLAESYGFRADFFWQPSVYSKDVREGERQAVGSFGTDPGAWRRATAAARTELAPGVVDLSTVLDDTDEPLMYDFVHTNELGARIVAEAIYKRLKPQLLQAAGERP